MIKNRRYKSRKKRNASLKWLLIGGLFFCLLGGLAYFLIWSPYFWISRIEFESGEIPRYYRQDDIKKIIQEALDKKIWRLVPQKSVFLFSAKNTQSEISERYPEIKSVQVNKRFPNGLKLAIKERAGVGVWCQLEQRVAATSSQEEMRVSQCFNIDQEGIIYRESALVEGGFVLNIFSDKMAEPKIRDKVASGETMDFILKLKNELPQIKTADNAAMAANTTLAAVNFKTVSAEDLRVKTSADFEIFFNPSYSIETQLNALRIVLDNEIKESYASLEYIDLRIEGRVYYK